MAAGRREVAKKWAKDDGVAMMLLLGGIQSPLFKLKEQEGSRLHVPVESVEWSILHGIIDGHAKCEM